MLLDNEHILAKQDGVEYCAEIHIANNAAPQKW